MVIIKKFSRKKSKHLRERKRKKKAKKIEKIVNFAKSNLPKSSFAKVILPKAPKEKLEMMQEGLRGGGSEPPLTTMGVGRTHRFWGLNEGDQILVWFP